MLLYAFRDSSSPRTLKWKFHQSVILHFYGLATVYTIEKPTKNMRLNVTFGIG